MATSGFKLMAYFLHKLLINFEYSKNLLYLIDLSLVKINDNLNFYIYF